MCPFPNSKADKEEIEEDLAHAEFQDVDMGSEEEYGDDYEEEEDNEDGEETGVWTELDQRKADASLIMLIVGSYQHISIIESLKRIMEINIKYVMPDRNDIIERVLPHMYNVCLNEQKTIVQEAVTVCLTIEQWMSNKEESIMSITAHFINSDFELKSVLIKCCEFYDDDTEETAAFFKETCTEWDIFNKINGFVTDKTENMKQAANLLGWNQFGCTAHTLNLILQKSLELSKPVLVQVQQAAHDIENDPKTMDMLIDYQTNVQGRDEPMLDAIMDAKISLFSAAYDMIEEFISLQDGITATWNENCNGLPEFTSEDWLKLNQLYKIYKPFYEATKELGEDKYVYGSKVIALVNSLKNVLQEMNGNQDFCYVKDIIKCMQDELNKQFEGIECEPNLAMCTILDPRYKMSVFIDLNAAEVAKANLVKEVENLMKANINTDLLNMELGENKHVEGNEGEEKGNMIYEKILIDDPVNSIQRAQQEVDSYVQGDLANCDSSLWWQAHQQEFPHIAQLFKTKCNIVASSILSCHLFSEKGIDLCANRPMLSADKAKFIVFLKANLKDDEDYLKVMP